MDHERFDRLARHLATGANRRGILKGVVGGATAMVAGGLLRRPAGAEDTSQCQTTVGVYCNPAINQNDHQCCASANLECNLNHPVPEANGVGGSCQCTSGFAVCNGQCISTEHCCESNNAAPFEVCEAGSEQCVNGACQATCVAVGGNCNVNHPCCHLDQYHCTSTTTETGTCVANAAECVAVDQPCNVYHPCCHPDQFVCSSTTETPGTCERIEVECVAVGGTCNQYHPCCHAERVHCTSTTTETGTCVENEVTCGANKQLCAAPGYTSKCCPVGHQCHRHERSKTFDCRAATNTNGGGKKNGKQNHKRGRKK